MGEVKCCGEEETIEAKQLEVSPLDCSMLEDGSGSTVSFRWWSKLVQGEVWYGFFSSHSLCLDQDRFLFHFLESCFVTLISAVSSPRDLSGSLEVWSLLPL